MAFELAENKIMFFTNKKKKATDPLVTGKVKIDSTEYKLAGWRSKSDNSIVSKLTVKSGDSYVEKGTVTFDDNLKKSSDKMPDKVGTLTLGEVILSVSLWKKEGKNGVFLSGVVADPSKSRAVAQSSVVSGSEDIF